MSHGRTFRTALTLGALLALAGGGTSQLWSTRKASFEEADLLVRFHNALQGQISLNFGLGAEVLSSGVSVVMEEMVTGGFCINPRRKAPEGCIVVQYDPRSKEGTFYKNNEDYAAKRPWFSANTATHQVKRPLTEGIDAEMKKQERKAKAAEQRDRQRELR